MRIVTLLSILFTTFTVFGQINTGNPAIPFGSKINAVANPYGNGIVPTNLPTGSYAPSSGQYGKSQDAADAYNTWKTNYVEACGSNFRVKFDTPSQTVSEGIGYGMLIAAYAGDKTLFDGLWGYYKANSDGNGLMNWRTGACSPDQSGGATDADLDAAMALLVAKCQWPSAVSPYIYSNEATNLITAIKNAEIHNTLFQAINGDGWGFGNNCRNPGYQSPAYYRQFASQVTSQATTWNSAVAAAYTLLNANRNTTTGLITNWSDQNGVANNCNGGNIEFGYDACRNPWRMATDVLWYGNGTAQTNFCIPIAAYVNGQGSNASGPVPQAGGAGKANEATFSAMFAAGICGSNATYQTIMNSMYTKTVGTVDALPRYFGNTLRVISLFMQTGNFWAPCVAAPLTISVSLTAPTSGQTYNEGDAITLAATATTTNGTITKVEFYNGTILIGTATSSPYTISWTTAAAGTNQILVKAYNSVGDAATTTSIPILVIKSVYQTATTPTIDGVADAMWSGSNTSAFLNNLIEGAISGPADLSANYKAMWDANYFYLLVNVTDDVKVNNGGTDIYNDDAVEVFFDIGNLKPTSFTAKDFQYTFRWNDNTVYELNNKITGVTFGRVDNATGYVMEMRFPWSTLTGIPSINQLVGFDVEVDDDDDGGARDAKISWAATADQAWQNPTYMGTVILKGTACTTPGAAGTISGTTSTCAGTTGIIYSTSSVSGATSYDWILPSGATITNGINTNSITVSVGSIGGTISVTPKNTCGNGTSNSISVTVSAIVTPNVTIAASQTTICSGTSVTFTATPINGGTPSYQWRTNGLNITGATAVSYVGSGISNNDKFDVVMTSTANCVSKTTATSPQIAITVGTTVTPSVTIAASQTTICSGASVTFTATPTNGGTPSYQWRKNGVNITGATGVSYVGTGISNNDNFDVVMISNASCLSTTTATSTQIAITVGASVTPSVTISASQTSICTGASVTFTGTPVNGGTPTYQWRKNGVNISGATAVSYVATGISNNDNFDVVMTSTASCLSTTTATSTQIAITVGASVTPSVTISASQTSICTGASVTFTGTPVNGGAPMYQWRKNGVNISGATAVSYVATGISNNDNFDVVMTSTASCLSTTTATSTQIAITVGASVTPSVTISASQTSICTGASVTFTGTPVNGGAPTYQWRKNGVNISGATAVSYVAMGISNNDNFDVVMISNASCLSTTTATSTQIAITVGASVTPSVTISASQTSICTGASVTFTGTPVNGGTPMYQWRKKGVNISGATAVSYVAMGISNNDNFDVVMISNASCLSTTTATSTPIAITVGANVTPSVAISASQTSICSGGSVMFTGTPVNGGTPTYQWRKNGANISGAVGVNYVASSISNNDKFDVVMTSTASCISIPTATSTQTTITVGTTITPSVTIAASQISICAGASVTFTATPINGGAPMYQWRKNGVNISGAATVNYVASGISNNDNFDVVMTSTASCISASTVISGQTIITVGGTVTPSVSIAASQTNICSGTSVTFTATPVNGGTPTYQWKKNGVNISGATAVSYVASSIINSDNFDVVMTSTASCISTATATSNSIKITITSSVLASVTVTVAPSNNAYEGQSLTFTANPINGGGLPTYQWENGGTIIVGATSALFTTTSLQVGGNPISVTMTSNSSCVAIQTVSSPTVNVTINPMPSFTSTIIGPTNVISNQTYVSFSVPNQNGMSYVWTVPQGATIISGQNTNAIAVNFGTTSGNISVTQTNPLGQASTISAGVQVGNTTPVDLPSEGINVSAYPIPCDERVNLSITGTTMLEGTYMLIDMTGNVVRDGRFEYSGTPIQIQTNVASGVYQLILNSNANTTAVRIVKY
jgi:endo-1,4-beta-D-glucanase Y